MSFELAGKLIVKGDTQQISERFKKREFVLEKEENNGGNVFTDTIKFQLVQDKCDLLDNIKMDDQIKVSFNIRGNKWEKNGTVSYFVNLDAWRIEKLSGSDQGATNDPFPPVNDAPFPDTTPDNSIEEDDLPF